MARESKRLTQEELASKSGLSVATIAKIEQGVASNPRLETFETLAAALGMTIDEILKM